MSRSYIISDTHFGHRNICKYRPNFSDAKTHDETIVENILQTCNKRDVLWLLGDCFFTWESVEYLKEMHKHIGYINFIIGNHDTDKPERVEILKDCIGKNYFHKVGSVFKMGDFWLSHPPIHPCELYGRVNIHGHVHSKTIQDENFINVSCENVRFRPINIDHLKDIRKRKKVLVHYGNYDHDCNEFIDGNGERCLICDRTKN